MARPGLRKRAVPAEAEPGLRARQGGAHTPDSVRRWRGRREPFPQRFGRGRGRGLSDRREAGRTSAGCRGRPRSGLCGLAVAPGLRGLGEPCPSGAPQGGGGGGPGGPGETPARLSTDVIAAQLLRDQYPLTALELHTELLAAASSLGCATTYPALATSRGRAGPRRGRGRRGSPGRPALEAQEVGSRERRRVGDSSVSERRFTVPPAGLLGLWGLLWGGVLVGRC